MLLMLLLTNYPSQSNMNWQENLPHAIRNS